MLARWLVVTLLLSPLLSLAQGTSPSGGLVVPTGKALVPATDLGASLGTSGKRFLNLFAANWKDGNSQNRFQAPSLQSNTYTDGIAVSGGTDVGHLFTTRVVYSAAGSLLMAVANNGVLKLSVNKDGKLLGTFATPQYLDLSYGANGIGFRTGSVLGGEYMFADSGGNPFFHVASMGVDVGAAGNPVPVVHAAQTTSPVALEFAKGTASAGGVLAVSFATAFGAAPTCICVDQNAVPVVCGITTPATTAGVTFSLTVARADTVAWQCLGAR